MYTQYFGLREKPFSITPDPRYLYLSQRHADALAHLIYGISHSGGFIQLTGEVGTGKTTLIRTLFEQLPDEADVALILNPELTVTEFLAAIIEELKIAPPAERSGKSLIDALNRHLLDAHARGRRTVLIVDEAQNLAPAILEQVRLLTNLETPKQKLLQIILIGQPELRELLAREDMRQLAQRVTGRYHLEPLDSLDTRKYLEHRLKVAGASGGMFTPSAVREIYRRSHGIPRLINIIADRALLAAYTRDTRTVDKRIVRRAAAEVFGKTPRVGWKGHAAAALTVAVLAAIGLATIYHTTPRQSPDGPALEQAAVDVVATEPMPRPPAAPIPAAPIPAPPIPAQPIPAEAIATEPVPAPPVPPAPVAAEPAAPPMLGAILDDATVPKDTDSAFATLFALWGAEFSLDAGPPCEQAQRQLLLRCLYQRGTLSHLRRVNRPAILSLVGDDGREAQMVLSRLADESATLMAGDRKYSIDVDDLAEFWYGDYLVLWQPGHGSGSTLGPGSSGEGVIWLRQALAQIGGEAVPARPSDYYDSALEARVRDYQRERRLAVDGIAGTQTQIVISNELAAPGTPLLSEGH